MKKLDYILIVVYIFLAIGIFWFSFHQPVVKGAYVEIYLDNELWGRYELPKTGYRDIIVKGSGENVIRISSEGVRVINSDCRQQLCVHQGWIKNSNGVIACLPNGLLVQIVGEEDSKLDIISY